MPGLCGSFVPSAGAAPGGDAMWKSLEFGSATTRELFHDERSMLACVHIGVGGQRAVHVSDTAVVAFFGHLTRPEVPPGSMADGRYAAAYIHDSYTRDAETFLTRIAGAFACAIWDRRQRQLLLITDHLGLRPIYYASRDGWFGFASEFHALVADGRVARKLDVGAVADFFHHNYVMGDKTVLCDVKLVPPASVLTWQNGRCRLKTYYDLPYPKTPPARSSVATDEMIHETLRGAIRRIVRPGFRYGLSLSGGLDSRWLAILCRSEASDIRTFTFGPAESDEVRLAALVARRLNLSHERVELSGSFISEYGETIARLSGGMYNLTDAQEFPLGPHMSGNVDISLGGLLGDILFGHEMNPLYRRLRRKDVVRYWMWRTQRARLPGETAQLVFGKRRARMFMEMASASLRQAVDEAPCSRGYQIAQYVNLRQRQRRFINIAQLCKLPYVEISHPLADREVVEMALQLNPDQLFMERAYRRAMVRHYPELADIPWTFAMLPPGASDARLALARALQLPIFRRMRGFKAGGRRLVAERKPVADYRGWSRTILRPFIEQTLLSPHLEPLDIFEPDGLRKAVSRHMAGELDITSFLGRAVAVALWAKSESGPHAE